MAVPVARVKSMDGVVLHLRGGNASPPGPPPCHGGAPASYTYLRSTGSTDAPRFLDLYYIPAKVGTAVNLLPGFYATLAPGDEFEVIVAANWSGVAARDHTYRALLPSYHLDVSLSVDGVKTESFAFWSRRSAPDDISFRGWPQADDQRGRTVGYRGFRMDRTVGVAGDAATAAADASPDLGCLSLTWRPSRVTGVSWTPRAECVPAPAAVLSEREAMKNRSLVAGVGTLVKVKSISEYTVGLGCPLPAEEVNIYYRERRVLVARKVLLENGEVAPAYRAVMAAGTDGVGASQSAAGPAVVAARGSPSGPSRPGKGKGPRRDGSGSPACVVKPEGGLGGAAVGATGFGALTPVKSESNGAGAGTAASAEGKRPGSRKRKAEVERDLD